MNKTVLYIAGPMTGLPDWNRPAFCAADESLRAAGYSTLNPARHPVSPRKTWADYMRLGISDVLAANGIAVLDGWVSSQGAWLEVTVARALGVRVAPVERWMGEKA
jgi:hypothetical protein